MRPNVHIPASLSIAEHSIDIKVSISIDDLLNAASVPPPPIQGRPRKVSKEHERLLYALINTGVQAEDIAEAFGISRATLYRCRRRFERSKSGTKGT